MRQAATRRENAGYPNVRATPSARQKNNKEIKMIEVSKLKSVLFDV